MSSRRVSLVGRLFGLAFVASALVGLGCLHSERARETEPRAEVGDWQSVVDSTAEELRADHPGSHVRIGVMRVDTGDVVASTGGLDERFGSGSTIKPLTVAAALEEGVPGSTVFNCSRGVIEYGGNEYRDHVTHESLSMTEVLAVSSNVGIVRLLERISPEDLLSWLERQGVESAGRIDSTDAGGAAIGVSLNLTLNELLMAYATIANDGVNPSTDVRILQSETASTVLGMLAEAVHGPSATGRRARVDGMSVAGKTGTTERRDSEGTHRTATFVGLVPAERPQWVIAVSVDGVGPDAAGGTVAAPAFASIVRESSRARAGAE